MAHGYNVMGNRVHGHGQLGRVMMKPGNPFQAMWTMTSSPSPITRKTIMVLMQVFLVGLR